MVGKGVQCGASTSNIGRSWGLELVCFTESIITWDLAEAEFLRRGNIEAGKSTSEGL